MRRDRLAFALTGGRVAAGPFEGLQYVPSSEEHTLGPKLMGTYEVELAAAVDDLLRAGYERVINVGAADGYYAVGMAYRNTASEVVCFETNARSRRICAALASANGVLDNILLAGSASQENLRPALRRGALLIVDCEGCEVELLDPVRLPDLLNCDMLIEAHDDAVAGATSILLERFQSTHRSETIFPTYGPREVIPEIATGLPPSTLQALTDEARGPNITWCLLRRRLL